MSEVTDLKTLLEIPFLSLHVFEARYGGGFIAFVCHDPYASEIIDLHTGGDSCYAEVSNSLVYAVWYPQASGDTPAEAITKLELFLQNGKLAKSPASMKYTLDMLLTRIADKNGKLISTEHPKILRRHSEGPFSDTWVGEVADILDEVRNEQ